MFEAIEVVIVIYSYLSGIKQVPACITSLTIKRKIVRPKTNREKQYTKIQKHTHKIKILKKIHKGKNSTATGSFKDPRPHPDTFKCSSLISVSFSFLPGGGGQYMKVERLPLSRDSVVC